MRVQAAAKFVPAFNVHTINSNLSGHQKPKIEKSGTSILLEAITSEVYRIRNSWNLEVFYAKPWCKVKMDDINGLFGNLEKEEGKGEWLSSILFGYFLKLVRRK